GCRRACSRREQLLSGQLRQRAQAFRRVQRRLTAIYIVVAPPQRALRQPDRRFFSWQPALSRQRSVARSLPPFPSKREKHRARARLRESNEVREFSLRSKVPRGSST